MRERLLTEEDENIRARDVPERMQLRYQGIIKDELEPLSERDQIEEAQWIARILSRSKGKDGASDTLQQAVRHVVRFLTEEFLEVPFIAAHRRDYFTSVDPNSNEVYTILDLDDLWSIYDLDFRFRGFLDRRSVLQEFYNKLGVFDDLVDDMIAKAERVEEIADLTDYLHFRYAEDVERIKRSHGTKKPPIKSQYESELKMRLRSFAKVCFLCESAVKRAFCDFVAKSFIRPSVTGTLYIVAITSNQPTTFYRLYWLLVNRTLVVA